MSLKGITNMLSNVTRRAWNMVWRVYVMKRSLVHAVRRKASCSFHVVEIQKKMSPFWCCLWGPVHSVTSLALLRSRENL